MECSAKNNVNIRELMRQFLSLAKITFPNDDCALRRRSSAHASVSKLRGGSPLPASQIGAHLIPELVIDAITNPSGAQLIDQSMLSVSNSSVPTTPAAMAAPSLLTQMDFNGTSERISLGQRLKPRSRSLIRRTSKKVNKVKDPNSEPDDCYIS
jgi:hypothetical protein